MSQVLSEPRVNPGNVTLRIRPVIDLQIHVYRPHQVALTLENVSQVTADPELPGFVLDLQLIWAPDV